jgi:hypothetical protein
VNRTDDADPRFVGTWRLLSCETRDSSGQVQYPFGQRPIGQLSYDDAGNMSAHLMRADWPRFEDSDPAVGTDADAGEAFDRYIGYFGTYSIDGATSTVMHRVVGASLPYWVGIDLVRYYMFDETGCLRLATPPVEAGGRPLEYVLLWERIR